jgi:DNA-directed RNA polymerase specialized sigma24 family protein
VADAALRESELDLLMGRLAHGERAAFDPLYAALAPRALRVARSQVGPDGAKDVAQAALLKVFARASEFTPGRPCLPWFYAIVANEIRAARRKGRASAGSVPEVADDSDAERALVEKDLERALEVALTDLDETSADAVAAMLGRAPRPTVSSPAFRKRLSRAYEKLRMLLGEHLGSF